MFGPFIYLVNTIVFRTFVDQDDIKGHKVGVYEELEEQQLSMFHHAGVIIAGLVYPALGDNPQFFEKATEIKAYQLEFIKRCIVRTLYYHGSKNKAYVGCPLNFVLAPELFR